jgi:hypothetical protein
MLKKQTSLLPVVAKKTQPSKTEKSSSAPSQTSRDEQIGFHKGSLMTLSKERQEMVRIIGIVEQLMQMHASALQELGVKLDDASAAPQAQQPAPGKKRPPIEDIL